MKQPKGFGRVRLARLPDVSVSSLIPFLEAGVEPGASVMTDGWSAYSALPVHGYLDTRTILAASGDPAHVAMPAVHRVASLPKRWLLGTHQGSVSPEHLQAYLNEFAFRFNRRSSGRRGLLFYRLLEQAVATDPISYRELVVSPQPKSRRPVAPTGRRANPSSLALPPAGRPWRAQSRPAPQGRQAT